MTSKVSSQWTSTCVTHCPSLCKWLLRYLPSKLTWGKRGKKGRGEGKESQREGGEGRRKREEGEGGRDEKRKGILKYVYRSIERAAQHEAKRTEQKARGELDRQKLQNEQVLLVGSHGDNGICKCGHPAVFLLNDSLQSCTCMHIYMYCMYYMYVCMYVCMYILHVLCSTYLCMYNTHVGAVTLHVYCVTGCCKILYTGKFSRSFNFANFVFLQNLYTQIK